MENGTKHPRLINLQPHKGSSIDIIIGIDVGTTFSGVSYAFLRPGEVPEVQTVMRYVNCTYSSLDNLMLNSFQVYRSDVGR